jgi:hypothetical protein
MKARGKSAAHADAYTPKIPPDQWLSRDELMRRRRERAERSQEQSPGNHRSPVPIAVELRETYGVT